MIASPESFSPAITVGVERGLPYLADDGFNGQRWTHYWSETYAVDVITSPPKNVHNAWQRSDKKWLSHHRQIVETAFLRLC